MLWRMREGYFRGPGPYRIKGDDSGELVVSVDESGHFEFHGKPTMALNIYATAVGPEDDRAARALDRQ